MLVVRSGGRALPSVSPSEPGPAPRSLARVAGPCRPVSKLRVLLEGQISSVIFIATRTMTSRGIWVGAGGGGLRLVSGNWPCRPVSSPDEWRRIEFLLFGVLTFGHPRGQSSSGASSLQHQIAALVADSLGPLLGAPVDRELPAIFSGIRGHHGLARQARATRWCLVAARGDFHLPRLAARLRSLSAHGWPCACERASGGRATSSCLPVLLLNFVVFFSFSAMLAVTTRHTVACVFGSTVFWLLCWATNAGRHAFLSLPGLDQMPSTAGQSIDLVYWLLPKPLDAHILMFDLLKGDPGAAQFDRSATDRGSCGAWHPVASLVTTGLFAVVLLGITAHEFLTLDY